MDLMEQLGMHYIKNKHMKFTIELTEQQVNIVLQSLAKMPLEQVIETFTEIKQQAEKQLQDDTNK